MVDDEKIEFEAVLVSRNRGVIVFDLYSLGADNNSGLDEETKARQEKLYVALFNRLNSFSEIPSGRNLYILKFRPLQSILVLKHPSKATKI